MLTPPRGYAATLQRYGRETGRDLRIRWSEVEEQWLLELRAARPQCLERIARFVYASQCAGVKTITPESINRMYDGFILLGVYEPCLTEHGWPFSTGVGRDGLPKLDRLLSTLSRNDPLRIANTGNAQRDATYIADEMDQRWITRYRAQGAQMHSLHGDLASEMYDDAVWRHGLRVAVPPSFGNGPREAAA